ncbi:MAG: topoisomerase subunit [Candidatus Diapherotrites archaeon]|nr:topoisomerase subunit [Candidatus Diapherotrites archaeon]MDN5366696.1 topoisomerase subunit [Candidatus Diapherotrites archaeon]
MAEKDLFKEFKEHSVAEFFKKNKQMLGFSSKIRSFTTAVHEYVSNALDACEEAGILPELYVQIDKVGDDHYVLKVRDNGPGIPPNIVPKVFGKLLAGTKFHRMIPTRGQQGIGAAGVTMFAQMTTGKPVHVKTSRGDGVIWEMDVMIDVKRNEPIVKNRKSYEGEWRGTEVTAEMKEVTYNHSKYSAYEYIRRTAIANPHAQITLVEPDGTRTVWYRTSFEVVRMAKEGKPHPLGITVDDLMTIAHYVTKARKVSSMLKNELEAFGDKSVKELEKLVGRSLLEKSPADLQWHEAEKIVSALKQLKFRSPSTDVLISIGEDQIKKSLRANLKPRYVATVTRKPKVYSGGIPFLVEVGVAMDGDIQGFELMRYANRAPLLFEQGACAITQAVQSIDWKRYGVPSLNEANMVIFVNIVSTHIPYVSAGKQAIADVPEVVAEIRNALMEAGRRVREYTSKVSQIKELLAKKRILDHYLPELSAALAKILEKKPEDVQAVLSAALEERYRRLRELEAKIGVGAEE